MQPFDWRWVVIGLAAVLLGEFLARTIQRSAGSEQLRLAFSWSVVAVVAALFTAFLNIYPLIANGVALFALTIALRLRRPPAPARQNGQTSASEP
jgi:cytochrome bd-type quinol oxidase subunit 2